MALPLHVHAMLPFTEENLHEIKGGETDAYGDGTLDPVHAEPFVQASDESLFPNDVPHGEEDRPVRVAQCPCGLHPSTDHVQRVRGRLPDQACASPKHKPFHGVGFSPPAVIWRGERKEKEAGWRCLERQMLVFSNSNST